MNTVNTNVCKAQSRINVRGDVVGNCARKGSREQRVENTEVFLYTGMTWARGVGSSRGPVSKGDLVA